MFVSKKIHNNRYPPLGIYGFTDHFGNAIYKGTIVHHQGKIEQRFLKAWIRRQNSIELNIQQSFMQRTSLRCSFHIS